MAVKYVLLIYPCLTIYRLSLLSLSLVSNHVIFFFFFSFIIIIFFEVVCRVTLGNRFVFQKLIKLGESATAAFLAWLPAITKRVRWIGWALCIYGVINYTSIDRWWWWKNGVKFSWTMCEFRYLPRACKAKKCFGSRGWQVKMEKLTFALGDFSPSLKKIVI